MIREDMLEQMPDLGPETEPLKTTRGLKRKSGLWLAGYISCPACGHGIDVKTTDRAVCCSNRECKQRGVLFDVPVIPLTLTPTGRKRIFR